jgi:hypothetical protein
MCQPVRTGEDTTTTRGRTLLVADTHAQAVITQRSATAIFTPARTRTLEQQAMRSSASPRASSSRAEASTVDAVGILKYRLFEIDRLISRTISYLLVSGLLAGAFAGIVVLTTRVLPFSSPVGVAASTLAAAGLFNPLRRRVKRLVDRRFNRARYNAEATAAAFGARLRDAANVETVLDELAAAAGHSLEPSHVTVWVRGAP